MEAIKKDKVVINVTREITLSRAQWFKKKFM